MSTMWWKDLSSFTRDAGAADDSQLRTMREWASRNENASDQRGMGRNPKARRSFRLMRQAAEEELDRRGLLWS